MGAGPSSEIGQVVLVTGCSQGGIGHELAKELAKRGCKVVASARSMPSMNSLVDLPGIHCLCLDVTDSASVQQAVENVVKKYGRLDVLVNNAGTSCPGPVAELPLDLLQGTFQTNVFGAIRTIQASIPYMVAQGSGRVVNIGSVAAYLPSPWVGGYAASKCALHALTDSLSSLCACCAPLELKIQIALRSA